MTTCSAVLDQSHAANAELHFDPWPHLVVDDFLPPDLLQRSLTEIESDDYDYGIEYRGTGRIEYSLLKSKTLWRAIYSRRTIALLESAFGVDVSLNKHNVIQLRRMNEATPDFPVHSDFTADADTIASFLYLSPGWSAGRGGCLNLFGSKEQPGPSQVVAPLVNRFVAFRTSAAHWHSVDRVHGWERRSVLALWDVETTRVVGEEYPKDRLASP